MCVGLNFGGDVAETIDEPQQARLRLGAANTRCEVLFDKFVLLR